MHSTEFRIGALVAVLALAAGCRGEDVGEESLHQQTEQSVSPAQQAQPRLVRNANAAATPDETLARWTDRADAIGVFHCTEGTPFLRDPSDPHSISTRFTLEHRGAIKGEPPSSVVQAGGRIGDLEIESIHDGRIRVGDDYLGFFANDGRLFAAVKVKNGDFRVKGQPYSVATLQASSGGR